MHKITNKTFLQPLSSYKLVSKLAAETAGTFVDKPKTKWKKISTATGRKNANPIKQEIDQNYQPGWT